MSVQVRVSAARRETAMQTLVDALALLPPTADLIVTIDGVPSFAQGGAFAATGVIGEPDPKETVVTLPARITNNVLDATDVVNVTGGMIPLPQATAEQHAGFLHSLLSKVESVIGLATNPAIVALIPDSKLRAYAQVLVAVEQGLTGGVPGMPVQ